MMIVWMEVTRDKYELPKLIADSAAELAVLSGATENNVSSSASKYKKGIYRSSRFRKVEVPEDEE